MGNLFSCDLSNYHPSNHDPSILRGSLLAVGDTVVAARFCCRKARAHLAGILVARPGETRLPRNGTDRRHGFTDFAFALGGCCKPVVIFLSAEVCG